MVKIPGQRDSAATRQRLLDAATEAFAAAGLEGVRVDQLAAAAGVNKRMIYHYFGDKRGLYDAVLAAAGAELSTPFDLAALAQWQTQVAQGLSGSRARLLAWEGLRLGSAAPETGTGERPLNSPGTGEQDVACLLYTSPSPRDS